MDQLKGALGSLTGGQQPQQAAGQPTETQAGLGGMLGQIGNATGIKPKEDDMLDKGIDFVQGRVLGMDQTNESPMEKMMDEQIATQIRDKYKSTTGSEFPIKDKQ